MQFVGKSQPIHDAVQKAIGSATYAGDMILPRMAHCAVVFSSVPHGIVKKVDASKALALPGVVAVLDCFNTTNNMFNRFRNAKGQQVNEQEQVFTSHVRFVGDRVACVVAQTAKLAREAAALVEVEYQELPFTIDMQESLNGKIDQIHDDGAVYGDFTLEVGEAPKQASGLEELTSFSHLDRVNHMTMEPHACVAHYDRALGELTVWSPNQSVHGIRTVMADLFEISYEKVRIIKTTMGGSFGAKQEWMLEPVAIAATLKTGIPVKLVYNRGEAMISTICRCPLDATFSTKFTKEGKIVSIDADVTLDAGAYLGNSYDYIAAIASKFYRCYQFDHVNYKGRAVCTNSPVSGAFRGWSGPETAIILEHNLNMIARKLKMDPLELRLKNISHPGDFDRKNNTPLGEIRIHECIEQGRKQFDYDQKKKDDKAFNKNNKRLKRGTSIACGGHVNGYYPRTQDFAGAEMRMAEDGGLTINCTIHDHGCGTVTAMKMIAAESLGISTDRIRCGEGDTAYTPIDVGCFASRTTYVIGRTVLDCTEKLKQVLIDGIAEIHKIDTKELTIKNAHILGVSDQSISYSYAAATCEIYEKLQREVWVKHQYVNPSNPGVTGAHFAHVEVDTYTGMVKIIDYLAVHDIGQVINREICIAQIQGAVIMGAGAALSEKVKMNPNNARPFSSMKDYHLINFPAAPNIQVSFIEDGGTDGPFGAKSIGEACHTPVAPAVVGAVNDALESDLCSLPLDPDRIVELMQTRQGASANAAKV